VVLRPAVAVVVTSHVLRARGRLHKFYFSPTVVSRSYTNNKEMVKKQ
jgi:hypothetical protein